MQAKYYNLRRRKVKTKMSDKGLVETHVLCSAAKDIVVKFTSKYEGPYEVIHSID